MNKYFDGRKDWNARIDLIESIYFPKLETFESGEVHAWNDRGDCSIWICFKSVKDHKYIEKSLHIRDPSFLCLFSEKLIEQMIDELLVSFRAENN